MNLALIGLFALLAIFVYLLYYFSKAVSLLQGVTSLNTSSTITGNKLEISTGKTVYYDFWVFIVETPDTDRIILSREFHLALNGNTLKFYKPADNTTITNGVISNGVPVTGNRDTNNTVNLPSGKWVFVSINVNEKIMEVYLNGKLVKTMSMSENLNIPTLTALTIGGGINGYITKLRRLTKPMTSDFVWTKYLEGNGQFSGVFGGIFNYMDTYHANITLTNGDKKNVVKLF